MFLSFEDWYSLYRFDEDVNQDYTLFSTDTTITIDGTEIPLRFEFIGTRLQDETLNTDIGTFECKKFLIERGLSFLIILPPPLPPIAIPIAFINDTIWIAADNWIVQSIIPTTEIDLSLLGGGIFFLPGLQSKIIDDITDVNDDYSVPVEFDLFQNYPNPFNPSTKIRFTIPTSPLNPSPYQGEGQRERLVTLKVFDILGNEIITLINKELPAGEYDFTFDASELSSGIYFYKLKAGSFIVTKKMVLIR
ncbi:MAG: T9SS type A sorting domain-containing protein [Bacteroidetes bacterium]|nr:T9SS type A sorting domain-containing protein [Bacteroidota bacterium]